MGVAEVSSPRRRTKKGLPIKPRRFILENSPYHTISVTRKREPVFASRDAARLLLESVQHARTSGRAYVLAFAILPDHLHLLIVPKEGFTVSRVMMDLKRYAAKAINVLHGRSGPIWQQSFYDRVIRDEVQLRATIEYIQQNPVKARLSTSAEDYPYSSSHPAADCDLEAYLGG
jgi:REP element-mobilizing transposase RayT